MRPKSLDRLLRRKHHHAHGHGDSNNHIPARNLNHNHLHDAKQSNDPAHDPDLVSTTAVAAPPPSRSSMRRAPRLLRALLCSLGPRAEASLARAWLPTASAGAALPPPPREPTPSSSNSPPSSSRHRRRRRRANQLHTGPVFHLRQGHDHTTLPIIRSAAAARAPRGVAASWSRLLLGDHFSPRALRTSPHLLRLVVPFCACLLCRIAAARADKPDDLDALIHDAAAAVALGLPAPGDEIPESPPAPPIHLTHRRKPHQRSPPTISATSLSNSTHNTSTANGTHYHPESNGNHDKAIHNDEEDEDGDDDEDDDDDEDGYNDDDIGDHHHDNQLHAHYDDLDRRRGSPGDTAVTVGLAEARNWALPYPMPHASDLSAIGETLASHEFELGVVSRISARGARAIYSPFAGKLLRNTLYGGPVSRDDAARVVTDVAQEHFRKHGGKSERRFYVRGTLYRFSLECAAALLYPRSTSSSLPSNATVNAMSNGSNDHDETHPAFETRKAGAPAPVGVLFRRQVVTLFVGHLALEDSFGSFIPTNQPFYLGFGQDPQGAQTIMSSGSLEPARYLGVNELRNHIAIPSGHQFELGLR